MARLRLAQAVLVVVLVVACLSPAFAADLVHCQPIPALADPRFPDFSTRVVNGARVYFRRTPVDKAAIAAVMEAGMGDQQPDEAHCAHMAEHMVLVFPDEQGRSVVSAAGGFMSGIQFNVQGGTLLDSTGFIISVENAGVPGMVSLLMDRMFRTNLHAGDEFVGEIKRSRRELDSMTTSPVSALVNKLKVTAFRGTPYEEKLFETPLTAVTAERIRGFMEREYTPSRLVLAIVADVDERLVLEAVERALSELEPGAGPAERHVALSAAEPETLELPGLQKPSIGIAIGMDGVDPEDRSSLESLLGIVWRRLYRHGNIAGLRFEISSSSMLSTHNACVYTLVYSPPSAAAADVGQVKDAVPQVIAEIRQVLESLGTEGVTPEDLIEWSVPGSVQIQEIAAQQFTPACLEAMGVANRAAMEPASADSAGPAPALSQDETMANLQAVARRYFPEAKFTSVVTAEKPSAWTSGIAAAVVVTVCAAGAFLLLRRSWGAAVP